LLVEEQTQSPLSLAVQLVIEEQGIGAVAGVALTLIAWLLQRYSGKHHWQTPMWSQLTLPGLAILCFATAQALGEFHPEHLAVCSTQSVRDSHTACAHRLAGTRFDFETRLFIGWFGPRGLASIVFAVMILDYPLQASRTLIAAAVRTVSLSVLLHGLSANPWVSRLA
jgi:NhaP-type Na+/H+ or K+/H+ antiporter